MRELVWTDAAMVAAVVLLIAELIVLRARSRRRQGLMGAARARFEDLVAAQLVSEEPVAAPAALGALDRRALLDVGVSALLELRGFERDRVAALLEAAGLVDAQAATLRDGRAPARKRAADLLGLIATPGTRAPLRGALTDPDPVVRLAAARGLAELGDGGAAAAAAGIADAAIGHNGGAVAELVLAIGSRAPGSLPVLYAETTSPAVRRLVAATIGELRLVAHAGLLREALHRDDDELAARAARGLGLLGDIDATDELIAVVRDRARPWFVRAVAMTALGQLGDPAAVPALTEELAGDREWPERRAAAEALARLGAAGEDALRAAGAATDGDVRMLAEAALDR